MKQIVLEKLDWAKLLGRLSDHSATEAGKLFCEKLKPDLSQTEIEERWRAVTPLVNLHSSGYKPPLEELPILDKVMRAAEMRQVLTGEDLRALHSLLALTGGLHHFAKDFANRCSTLAKFKANTYPLPKVTEAIDRAIDPSGQLRDDASPKLLELRQTKINLRKRIESQVKKLVQDPDIAKYLQDDFFTVRSERYVIPIKLDGRGRINGSIYDTSDSGQTLFIEPSHIAPLNKDLLELELSEKLEILRIYRELVELVGKDIETIRENYRQVVHLDFLNAQAKLAKDLDARPIKLVAKKRLALVKARHPLVNTPQGGQPVPNDIVLDDCQHILVISGPNAGGKTVVLKTVGMLVCMVKAGLLPPVAPESELFLFENIYIELGDQQSLEANLSTFSGHILGLKPIVETATSKDLVLLDEVAAGTEPQAGAAIAQAILEHLLARTVCTIATTHFDSLKILAINNQAIRNGSMEYSAGDYRPTYILALDVPGQSFGIEVASQMGLPESIIGRAKALRGSAAGDLDKVISQLNNERISFAKRQVEIDKLRIEAETAKARWQAEKDALTETRKQNASRLATRFEDVVNGIKSEFHQTVESMRKQLRSLEERSVASPDDIAKFQDLKKQSADKLKQFDEQMARLTSGADASSPGKAATWSDLTTGSRVFVKSLYQEGTVTKLQSQENIEIQIGLLKTRVSLEDLNVLTDSVKTKKKTKPLNQAKKAKAEDISLTLQDQTNSVDLRGMEQNEALDTAWKFIDEALLRGEARVILIHGHGTNRLKNFIREQLAINCPYNVKFRSGEEQEGGDGVTIIALDH